jgi:predicted kinase
VRVNRTEAGRLVVITGLPGSGKTTLAIDLAARFPAVRLCPDDWMMAAGIDLWDDQARDSIEQCQLALAKHLLTLGSDVVIEWGVWTRAERDALRIVARSIGSPVELHQTTAPVDELWRRIEERHREGRWGSRPIRRDDLEGWCQIYETPTQEELALYDNPQNISRRGE